LVNVAIVGPGRIYGRGLSRGNGARPAAALGTPTLAIFTVTDPAGAGVQRASASAIDLGGRGRVPALDDVRAAASRLLRQAPRC